jgi:hypothetical protein
MLISTTALEPNPLWVSGTSYAKGARVVWEHPSGAAVVYYVFESLVSSNTTEPGLDATKWLEIGPCNKCAMFDNRISTQTTATSPLTVVIEPGNYTSNIGLLNLVGNHIKVEMLVDGSVVYTAERDLLQADIYDWWDYYFKEDEQVTLFVLDNLPLYYSHQLRITLTGSGTVAIGHCLFGTRQDLGELQAGASATMLDYSKKSIDEFGQSYFAEGDYADEWSGQLVVDNTQLNNVKATLRALRATPTLYVGTSDDRFRESFVAFGWVRSHRIAVPYSRHSLLDLEIGALT